MGIEVTMAQVRKIAAAADEEGIPDAKIVEIVLPEDDDDEFVIAVREAQTYEQIRRRQAGPVLFLIDSEGRRLG